MNHRRRTAFTLVELLVVLGIITLLMAILMPALSLAREQARRTVDLNRIRQIALGCVAYAADNNGLYPPGRRYNWYENAPDGARHDHYRQWVRSLVWRNLRDRYGIPAECGTCVHVEIEPDDVGKYDASIVMGEDSFWGWIYWGGRQDIYPWNGQPGYISPKRVGGPKSSDTLITCMVEDCSGVSWPSSAPHVHGMNTALFYDGYKPFKPLPERIGVGYTDGSAGLVPFEGMTAIREYHVYPQGTLYYHKR